MINQRQNIIVVAIQRSYCFLPEYGVQKTTDGPTESDLCPNIMCGAVSRSVLGVVAMIEIVDTPFSNVADVHDRPLPRVNLYSNLEILPRRTNKPWRTALLQQ
jgi:hypothetical protein